MENTEIKSEDEGEVQPLAPEMPEIPTPDPKEIQKELAAKEKELESYKLQMRQMQAAQPAPAKAPNPLLLPEDQYSVDPQRFNQVVTYMEKLEEELIETRKEAAKATMRSRYDDFDEVVNDATVDRLAIEQPDVVDTVFRSTSKPAARLNTLYHVLKGNKPHAMRPASPQPARRRVQSPQTIPTSSNQGREYSYAGQGPSPEMEEKWMREMEPHMPGHMQGRRIK